MKLKPRDILIASVVGIVLVAGLLVFLLVLPANEAVKKLDTDLETAQANISSAQALLARRQEIKNRAAATNTEYLRLANAVPENPELPSLIIELQDTATEAGLQFRSLQPKSPDVPWTGSGKVPPPTYNMIQLDMTVYGSWADTVDFMHRLPKMPRQMRITKFDTKYTETAPPQAPDTLPKVPVTTEFTLETYMIPSQDTSGAAQ